MKIDYDVGDVVICVDASDGDACPPLDTITPIKAGSAYRVTGMVKTAYGPATLIEGEKPHRCACCDGQSGWRPDRFRKLPKADDEFTEYMRRMKPANKRVDA